MERALIFSIRVIVSAVTSTLRSLKLNEDHQDEFMSSGSDFSFSELWNTWFFVSSGRFRSVVSSRLLSCSGVCWSPETLSNRVNRKHHTLIAAVSHSRRSNWRALRRWTALLMTFWMLEEQKCDGGGETCSCVTEVKICLHWWEVWWENSRVSMWSSWSNLTHNDGGRRRTPCVHYNSEVLVVAWIFPTVIIPENVCFMIFKRLRVPNKPKVNTHLNADDL